MTILDSEVPTDAGLLPVLQELQAREPIFHRPELGTGIEDLERQMAPDFFEVGASGRRYSRAYVQEVLLDRYATGAEDPWQDQWQQDVREAYDDETDDPYDRAPRGPGRR